MVESQRHEDKATTEQHFFVSSLKPDTDKIAPAIRPHCKIENGCHWVLDVTFREDDSADPPTPGSGDCRRCATSRTSVHVAWPHGRAVTPRRESIPGGSVAASLLLTGVTTQPRVHASQGGCPPRGPDTTQPTKSRPERRHPRRRRADPVISAADPPTPGRGDCRRCATSRRRRRAGVRLYVEHLWQGKLRRFGDIRG